MTITNTNSHVLKPILGALLLCTSQLPAIAASAEHETQRHIVFIDDDTRHQDVWVVDVGTSLFADYDHDGYFGGFSLSFDVDTSYGDRDIYATIFLQLRHQSLVKLHTTEVFTIYSRSGADVYRIDAELVDNYQAGDYQVHIDIHDARNGVVLDSVSHESFRNLRNLPLEAEPYHDTTSAVIVTEFAGFSGPVLLLMLGLTALLRRARDRSGILGGILEAARAKPCDKHYEQAPNTAPAVNRLPF